MFAPEGTVVGTGPTFVVVVRDPFP